MIVLKILSHPWPNHQMSNFLEKEASSAPSLPNEQRWGLGSIMRPLVLQRSSLWWFILGNLSCSPPNPLMRHSTSRNSSFLWGKCPCGTSPIGLSTAMTDPAEKMDCGPKVCVCVCQEEAWKGREHPGDLWAEGVPCGHVGATGKLGS